MLPKDGHLVASSIATDVKVLGCSTCIRVRVLGVSFQDGAYDYDLGVRVVRMIYWDEGVLRKVDPSAMHTIGGTRESKSVGCDGIYVPRRRPVHHVLLLLSVPMRRRSVFVHILSVHEFRHRFIHTQQYRVLVFFDFEYFGQVWVLNIG